MITAELPNNELQRLEKLASYRILDTLHEPEYDDIVQLVATICKTPIADISLVDANRQWFKAKIGLDAAETPREIAFCSHTILQSDVFIIPDASKDARFADNPLVTEPPNIRFYAGMPLITPEGYVIGSLCAIDTKPRELDSEQKNALRVLAGYVVNLLELRLRDHMLEEKNKHLQQVNALKDKLISIIGHDIRSPLSQFLSMLQLINMEAMSPEETNSLLLDLEKIAESTSMMLENLLQWAAKLIHNGEITIQKVHIQKTIESVIAEISAAFSHKKNTIQVHGDSELVFMTDPDVIHFVVRNILTNAQKFTQNDTIEISWRENENELELSIQDNGIGFDMNTTKLFDNKNHIKSTGTAGEKGSGLGLMFCKDFIDRLSGTIGYTSEIGKGTSFTIHIPGGKA